MPWLFEMLVVFFRFSEVLAIPSVILVKGFKIRLTVFWVIPDETD